MPLKYLRIPEWFYHLGFVFLGLLYGAGSFDIPVSTILIASLLGSFYLAAGYSFNALCDDTNLYRKHRAIPLSLSSLFLLLCTIYLRKTSIFFAGAILLNYFYSHPRFLLKKNAFYNVLINGYLFAVLFLLGSSMYLKSLEFRMLVLSFFFMLVMFPYQLVHLMAHFKEDNVEVSTSLVQTYYRHIYLTILCICCTATFIYLQLSADRLFFIASVIFAIIFAFFVRIGQKQTFSVLHAQRMRVHIRVLGLIYGTVLVFAFTR